MSLEGAKTDPRSSLPTESHARNRAAWGLHAQEGGCGARILAVKTPPLPGNRGTCTESTRPGRLRPLPVPAQRKRTERRALVPSPGGAGWTLPKATSGQARAQGMFLSEPSSGWGARTREGQPEREEQTSAKLDNWTAHLGAEPARAAEAAEAPGGLRPLAATAKRPVLKVRLQRHPRDQLLTRNSFSVSFFKREGRPRRWLQPQREPRERPAHARLSA